MTLQRTSHYLCFPPCAICRCRLPTGRSLDRDRPALLSCGGCKQSHYPVLALTTPRPCACLLTLHPADSTTSIMAVCWLQGWQWQACARPRPGPANAVRCICLLPGQESKADGSISIAFPVEGSAKSARYICRWCIGGRQRQRRALVRHRTNHDNHSTGRWILADGLSGTFTLYKESLSPTHFTDKILLQRSASFVINRKKRHQKQPCRHVCPTDMVALGGLSDDCTSNGNALT